MKALYTFFTSAAIAAGALSGYLDYKAQKSRAASEAATPVTTGGAPAGGRAERSAASPRRGTSSALPPRQGDGNGYIRRQQEPQAASPSDQSPDLEPDLQEIRSLIAREEFQRAEELAGEILDAKTSAPQEQLVQAARLAAKARVFQRLAEAIGQRPRSGSGPMKEVRLANGNILRARKVREEGDRLVIELADGGTYKPEQVDVLQVRELDSRPDSATAKEDLDRKVAGLKHPVDLYLDGVQPYYRMGRHDKALGLLERILAMDSTQTDQVPLLFVPDADESVIADWRIAAGRQEPDLPEASQPLQGAPPSTLHAGTEPPPSTPPSTAPQHRPPPSAAGSHTRPPAAVVDSTELVRAAQLVAEAQMLYQGAARKEGKQADLHKAQERLERARRILETQPPGDETVHRLQRQVSTLLSDVVRAMPF